MQFRLQDIIHLRTTLAAEHEISLPLTSSKCGSLSQAIEQAVPGKPEISQRYLYEYLHLRLNKALKEELTSYGLNVNYVEKLVKYLGYQGVAHWIERDKEVPVEMGDQLASIMGVYYSYVRCNSGRPDLLKSPVRIFRKRDSIIMELQGKVRIFKGKPEIKQSCMFVLLVSDKYKQLHMVCKVGTSRSPLLIQYLFTGVSAGGDPIAGRGILVKESHTDYKRCRNEKIPIEKLQNSQETADKIIAAYFLNKETNLLKIGIVSTFNLLDLAP